MNNNLSLPENFKELEVYVPEWSLKTEKERSIKRACTPLEKLKKFQHETIGHIEKIIEYLNTFENDPELLPSDARRLYSLAQMIMEASVPIDLNWKTSDIEDVFPMERMKFYSPSI